jgi:hypothetical protein
MREFSTSSKIMDSCFSAKASTEMDHEKVEHSGEDQKRSRLKVHFFILQDLV